MRSARSRLSVCLSSGAVAATSALVLGLCSATPAGAEPDIKNVKVRVDALYHQAEQAQERYNDAKIELKSLRTGLRAVRSDEAAQDQRLDQVRADVRDSILDQYRGDNVAVVGQVVTSQDPQTFLGEISAMSSYTDFQAGLFGSYSTELSALDLRREATQRQSAAIAAQTETLRVEKAAVDQKLDEAKALLDQLEQDERERLLAASRSGAEVRLPDSVEASGSAQAAVDYALAQVGDAYVFGAAGPSAFDCSGLTMMAWAQAGVGLPHSSSAQYGSGARVSMSDLQPGDLVFYYSPISHVAMYIGNGLIVHAAHPGAGVRVDAVGSMPYVGAVRPG